jgi:hypothetical protein
VPAEVGRRRDEAIAPADDADDPDADAVDDPDADAVAEAAS